MENTNPNNVNQQHTINIQVPSKENIATRRSLVPLLFGLIIIFFFFNFFAISCSDKEIASIKGIDLITGTQLKSNDPFTGKEKDGENIPSNIWAIIAFGSVIVGLATFMIKEKREAIIGTVVSTVGIISLIILQIVIKKGISEKEEGMIKVDFLFPYWGALIALVITGYICYLRIYINQKSTNTSNLTENNTEPPIATRVESFEANENFDLVKWCKNNSKKVVGSIVLIISLFGLYYFFIRHDPEKDAIKVANSFCECHTEYNNEMIIVLEEFSKSFNEKKFKKQQEARSKLEELLIPSNTANSECIVVAEKDHNDFRNRYLKEEELLKQFDNTYMSYRGICNPSNQIKLSKINSDIENKILTIKKPEPSIEKIKGDLIGKKIQGWSFDYLSEFKESKILNTIRGNNRIEYEVFLKLYSSNSNSYHDCEIIAIYKQGYDGWYFDNVSMKYITYSNRLYPDKWVEIRPLNNCSFNVEDTYKIAWKTYLYGNEIISGPDAKNVTLPSSSIYYLKSREDKIVDVKFTYKPN